MIHTIIRKTRVLLAGLALACAGTAVAQTAFTHPGVLFSRADLDRMKANLNVEPWKSGYQALLAETQSSLTYTMRGPFAEVGREPNVRRTEYESDMRAVRNQAVLWYMTGNTAYAQKAVQIINAWSTTHTTWSGSTPKLTASWAGEHLVTGAEILRYTYPGWTAANTTNSRNYISARIYDFLKSCLGAPQDTAGCLGTGNQGAFNLRTMILAAVYLDDQTRFDFTVNAWKNEACVSINRNTLASGQVSEAGRDQTHSMMTVESFTFVAEAAAKQGVDLYSHLSNRLLATSEHWMKYNLGNDSVPFQSFGPCCCPNGITYSGMSAIGRGNLTGDATAQLIYGEYVLKRGLSAPYTDQYRTSKIENASPARLNTFFFKKTAQPVSNGTYRIINRKSGKALEAAGGGTANGTNVDQWAYSGANNQRWTLTHVGSNRYTIVGVASGKALDVASSSTADGANVLIWTPGTGNNQRWTISEIGGGYYRLDAVHSGKTLDVQSGSTADGANVIQWPYTGATNQQWLITSP